MLYNYERFNNFFSLIEDFIGCEFTDSVQNMFTDDIKLDVASDVVVYYSKLPKLKVYKNYDVETIKILVKNVYSILETNNLGFSSTTEDSREGLEYPLGLASFLKDGGLNMLDDPEFKLFAAFLYVLDAFTRGDTFEEEGFTSSVTKAGLDSVFPELSYRHEKEEMDFALESLDQQLFKASSVPDYLLESGEYIESDGYYYSVSSVLKMLTGFGSVSQALERQDLEPRQEEEELNMTTEERASWLLKKFKEKRNKNES